MSRTPTHNELSLILNLRLMSTEASIAAHAAEQCSKGLNSRAALAKGLGEIDRLLVLCKGLKSRIFDEPVTCAHCCRHIDDHFPVYMTHDEVVFYCSTDEDNPATFVPPTPKPL